MTDLHDRAKLRASQERKLVHACDVIRALIKQHMPGDFGEHEEAELFMMKARLTALIKAQHIINPERREATAVRLEEHSGEY